MLKPLLFILVIVMLIALVLNFDFFSETTRTKRKIEKSIESIKVVTTPKNELKVINNTNIISNEDNLRQELQQLLNKAQKLFETNKDNEALLVYEEVIKKSKNAKELTILKLFAEACFKKATIHYIYPSYDIDSAIESYELIINSFQNKHNKELLLLYMKAKIQQAQFGSKEELLLAYDELIEKFQNDQEKRFKHELEELFFAKSFALMGVNDEEAIELLDHIIAQYDDKSDLPDTVKYSILNNIELSIITSNDTQKYVDLAKQYMADSPDTKPLLDMLSIIKNAQYLDQTEALEAWNAEHSEYIFPDWDFSELRKWVNKMETPESQKRIRDYLDLFEKQKYKDIYKAQVATVPISPVYSDEATQNITQEEMLNEEVPLYEPDPYQNDILSTQADTSYPNPYSTYEPNAQTDGVSHTYQDEY